MRRLSLLSGSTFAACVIAISSSACAQDARTFDIPPGSLRDGLNQFAAQADQQLFYSGDLVAGLQTNGLRGRYSPAQALDSLLTGSGLAWSETRPGVIFLRRGSGNAEVEATVDEIVVTGTLLKGSGEQASPIVTLDRDALDRRGFGTVAETLSDLPQNYAGSGTPASLLALSDPGGSNSALATGVNLRGLGEDSTLVLVNGRRLAGTGFRGEFADVSALPSAAVERVDVLLDGASALYGADAVAGVVNIILRRSFDSHETRLRASAAEGGAEDWLISHLAGRTWATGSALVSVEYQQVNALNSADRDYTADGDLRPFGGSDRRTFFGTPGNILALNPALGAFVSQFAIRPGPTGVARTPADFAAGETNLASQLRGVDLTPDVERFSTYARMRQSLGPMVDVSGDIRYSRREYGFDNAATSSLFQVTSANPNFVSPNGSSSHLLGCSFFGDLGTSRRSGVSRSVGATIGTDVDLGRGWSLEAYVAFAEERGRTSTTGLVNSAFLAEALGNGPDVAATPYNRLVDGYFNPFGSGTANNPAVLDFIGGGRSGSQDRSRARSVNVLVEGSLFELPAGSLDIAVGAQLRDETFDTRVSSFTSSITPIETITPQQERSIGALFAEVRLPLVGEANARAGVESLELSLAGRLERYDDFGETFNPKAGLVWSPAEAWSVRATWGTSFRAPSLPQLNDVSLAAPTFLTAQNGASVLALYRYGGNPDLDAETAETWTIGFDYAPENAVRLSLNYSDTRFSDRIAQPVNENLRGALSDPALAPFVDIVDPRGNPADLALVQAFINDPSDGFTALFPATAYGAILDARWVNASAVEVQGLDVAASAPFRLGDHAFSLDANASYVLDYDTQLTPTSTTRSVVGRVGYPVRLRSRAGISWSRDDVTARLSWNHVSSYEDTTGRRIAAWNTADLQFGWSPTGSFLAGTRLLLNVQNLFDTDPPFYDSPVGFGYDPGQANLLGRVASLQLIKRW